MSATHVQFTPSVTSAYNVGSLPTPMVLPAVDASNPAMMLCNFGPAPVAVLAGTNTQPLAEMPGAIVLKAGQSRLVDIPGTQAMAQAHLGGAQLVFSRGTLADVWLFPKATTLAGRDPQPSGFEVIP